jgi:pantoate--beta-alanine ligase
VKKIAHHAPRITPTMQTITHLSDLRSQRAALPQPVGLVPTMGALHDGHLSLVRRAKAECASVIVTIFVNPTQFNDPADLEKYPNTLDQDLAMLTQAGVDLVWTPTPDIMYPPDFQTSVEVTKVTQMLEGATRPGHFKGVTTVVLKLFNAIQPQSAYFGQKDAQQVATIQQMVRDLNLPITVVPCPTRREADGLAMSSRNALLNPIERQAATILYRALTTASAAFAQGERDANILRQLMIHTIQAEHSARIDYVSCANPQTLVEQQGAIETGLLSMAVFIGSTRLIDNMVVSDNKL